MAKIEKTVDVTLVNNITGGVYYNNRGAVLDLESFGDEGVLTFGELKTMASSKYKSLLQNLTLLISEVDSEEFTAEDVIRELRLTKYYKELDDLSEDEIDYYDTNIVTDFVLNSELKEYDEKLKNPVLSHLLVDRTVQLYREKELFSLDKLKSIAEYVVDDELSSKNDSQYGDYINDLLV